MQQYTDSKFNPIKIRLKFVTAPHILAYSDFINFNKICLKMKIVTKYVLIKIAKRNTAAKKINKHKYYK
jgi:hypothetical protein